MTINEATTALLELVVTSLVSIAGYFLIPLVYKLAVAKIGADHANFIFGWADTLVKAVEQTHGPGNGDIKYNLAFSALKGLSQSHDIKIDNSTLQAAIEAAVLELQQGTKPTSTAVGNLVVNQPVDTPVVVSKEN
jgi:hypothetical protein